MSKNKSRNSTSPIGFGTLVLSIVFLVFVLLFTNKQLVTPDNTIKGVANVKSSQSSPLKNPSFEDATLSSGINFVHFQGDDQITGLNEVLGAGVCVLDFNNDQWLDIFFVGGSGQTRYFGISYWWQQSTTSKLFQNRGNGIFTDVTQVAGLVQQYWGMGCSSGDLDNDGDADLVVTTTSNNYLYRNNGDGTFSDVSKTAGLTQNAWSTSVSLSDYNKDGLLDIYVVNYLAFDKTLRTIESQSGFSTGQNQFLVASNFDSARNVLYENKGNLTFKDVTTKANLADASGRGLSALWVDITNNSYPDLVISNDKGSPNSIYLNQKNGQFINVSDDFKFSDLSSSNSLAIADLNNDSKNDIVISGSIGQLPKFYFATPSNNENANIPIYQDRAYTFIQSDHHTTPLENWSIGLHDFNNDGYTDTFFANGLRSIDLDTHKITVGQQNTLFLNQAGQQLVKPSETTPFSRTQLSSRGAAFADFDNDGDIDIVVTNNNDMAHYYRNETSNNGNWLTLDLVATEHNRDAIGSKLWLTTKDLHLYKEITGDTGFLSQSTKRVHFGLGNHQQIDQLTIQWPNNQKQSLNIPNINQGYVIEQGKGVIGTLPVASVTNNNELLLRLDKTRPANRSIYLQIVQQRDSELFYQEVKKIIKDPDTQVRQTAINLLANQKSEKSLKLLLQFLNDTDIENLKHAVTAVANYEDEQAIYWLLPLFSHENESIRLTTIEQFIAFYDKEEAVVHRKFLAVPYLINLLDDPAIDVRLAAIKALGRSESYRGVFPLIALLKDNNPDIQAAAANALGRIREGKPKQALITLANNISASEYVRAQALIALKRIGFSAEQQIINQFERTLSLDDQLRNIGVLFYVLADDEEGIVLNRKQLSRFLEKWLSQHMIALNNNLNKNNTRLYFFLINSLALLNTPDLDSYLLAFTKNTSAIIRLYSYLSIIEFGRNKKTKTIANALSTESGELQKELLLALADFDVAVTISKTTLQKLANTSETNKALIRYLEKVSTKNAAGTLVSIAANEEQKIDNRIAALNALIIKPYIKAQLPDALYRHKTKELRHLALKHWSIFHANDKKLMLSAPTFLTTLKTEKDFLGIIEICATRRENWANQAILNIIKDVTIPIRVKQTAVETIIKSKHHQKTKYYRAILASEDDQLLQVFLKKASLNTTPKLKNLIQAIFSNEKLSTQTRLLAAKHMTSNTNLLSTIISETHEKK